MAPENDSSQLNGFEYFAGTVYRPITRSNLYRKVNLLCAIIITSAKITLYSAELEYAADRVGTLVRP